MMSFSRDHSVYRARTTPQSACVRVSVTSFSHGLALLVAVLSVRKGLRRRYFALVSILSIVLVADNLERPCVLLFICLDV